MEPIIETELVALPQRIELTYIDYLLNHGVQPPSVYKFCQDLGIREDEFYLYFGSFAGLEKHIWKGFVERTVNRLSTEESFVAFSAREKILSFYFAFFEELKMNRSFVLLQLKNRRSLEFPPEFLKDFKSSYISFVDGILNVGKSTGEIARRPFLDKRYAPVFWMHMAFLLNFWKEDNSPAFEKTDAAIEKSVNLAFEFIGKGAVDSMIDFAKFLYQTRFK